MPVIQGTPFTDFLSGTSGADTINGNGGEDIFIGSAGNDQINGGPTIADRVMYELTGNGSLTASAGQVEATGFGTDTLSQIDIIRVFGSSGDNRIVVSGTRSVLVGGDGADTLIGGDTDDYLVGGNLFQPENTQAPDVLDGGDGDDELVIGPADIATGGSGADLFTLNPDLGVEDISDAAVITDFELVDNFTTTSGAQGLALLEIAPGTGDFASDSVITVAATGEFVAVIQGVSLSSFDGIALTNDTISGGAEDDVIFGEAGRDVIDGGTGDDSLAGGLGDDTLVGGPGDDTLDGGDGSGEGDLTTLGDRVDYSDSNSSVMVDLELGTATSETEGSDQLIGIEHVVASNHGDTLRGTESSNFLEGGRGSDLIEGRGGNDTIISGLGNGADTLSGGAGFDQLLVLSGQVVADGGDGPDSLKISGGNSTISGGAGADQFEIVSLSSGFDPIVTRITDFNPAEGDLLLVIERFTPAFPDPDGLIDRRPVSFETILANSTDVDGGVLIQLPGVEAIVEGYSVSELSREMFSTSATTIEAFTDGTEGDLEAFFFNGVDGRVSWEPGQTLTYSVDDGFGDEMRAYIEAALTQVERTVNLRFEEQDTGGLLQFVINPDLPPSVAGRAEVVDKTGTLIEIRSNDEPSIVIFHELGHALGLAHPEESDTYISEIHRAPFTLMQTNGLPSVGPLTENPDIPNLLNDDQVTGLFSLDLEALIELYGESEVTLGNDTYTFDTSELNFQGLHDSGGVDSIKIVDAAGIGVSLDLTPGGAFNVGTVIDAFNAPLLVETVHTTRATVIENVTGAGGNDFITGNDANNRLEGAGGNDGLKGEGGADRLFGGSGSDTLEGGAGNDFLRGDAGDDKVTGGVGNDTIFAGPGDQGDDTLQGDAGDDLLGGGIGNDLVIGGGSSGSEGGNDTLFGGSGDDTLLGGDWEDLNGNGKFDIGEQTLASSGANSMFAGTGNDLVYGAGEADTLGGGAGNDTLEGGGGNDVLYGGRGSTDNDDVFAAGAGADTVFGGLGNDVLQGGNGSDQLFGGAGSDDINGGAVGDSLFGGAGDDTLTGGGGADSFFFAGNHGDDVVSDFSVSEDVLFLANTVTDFMDLASVEAASSETTLGGQSGLLIDTGDGNSIFLVGVGQGDLTADNLST